MTFSLNSQSNHSPRTFAYLRVSQVKQDLEKNKNEILLLANNKKLGHVEFFEEKASGKITWRQRRIGEILEIAEEGDSIVVSELSRLGRSMLECIEILSLCLQRKINIYSVKGNWQLDNSIQSKIVAMAFSIAAEIERDLISQRTKEALQVRKQNGVQLGRPKGKIGKSKLDVYRPEIEALLRNGSSQRFVAKRYNTTEANLFHWMQKHGIKRPSPSLQI